MVYALMDKDYYSEERVFKEGHAYKMTGVGQGYVILSNSIDIKVPAEYICDSGTKIFDFIKDKPHVYLSLNCDIGDLDMDTKYRVLSISERGEFFTIQTDKGVYDMPAAVVEDPRGVINEYEDVMYVKEDSKFYVKVNTPYKGFELNEKYEVLGLTYDDKSFILKSAVASEVVHLFFIKDNDLMLEKYKGSSCFKRVNPIVEEGAGPSDGWGYVADRSGVDRKVVKGYLSDLASGRHSVLELAVNYNLEPAKMGHINDLFREWMSNEL